jgi:hypothetical protein
LFVLFSDEWNLCDIELSFPVGSSAVRSFTLKLNIRLDFPFLSSQFTREFNRSIQELWNIRSIPSHFLMVHLWLIRVLESQWKSVLDVINLVRQSKDEMQCHRWSRMVVFVLGFHPRFQR